LNSLQSLKKLLVYRNILSDPLLLAMMDAESGDSCETAGRLVAKAEEIGLSGDIVKEYIIYLLNSVESVFSRTAEHADGKIGDGLLAAAEHDVKILRGLFRQDMEMFCWPLLKNYRPTIPGQSKSRQGIRKFFLPDGNMTDADAVRGLRRHYRHYGYGALADYMAFKWDEKGQKLVGVNSCDNITFDGLIGYGRQKKELIDNTEAFLKGLPANNVLLFGERGAGKSSSVKALINKFFDDGLRLVEIPRSQFAQLPAVMGGLKNWGKKFILYLDDLSFEEFEVEYKQLKSIIDGGIEAKPDNVLIYATSNRRNIVKEVWADNEGDELHRSDTINEKVSLADRFGVKIFFPSPDQRAYFEIIAALAARAGLDIGEDELRREAVKWEMSHTGRSGRIASQLIAYLGGRREAKAGDN
jgi:predicted AAA+ superfamily ATPase